jgi:nucleotide-binding universal stress UspA family protein
MIVLGTHGKGLLDTALFGSTTERVVRKAPCPVLTCRPAEHDFVD